MEVLFYDLSRTEGGRSMEYRKPVGGKVRPAGEVQV